VVDCIDAVEDIQMSGNYHSGFVHSLLTVNFIRKLPYLVA